MVKVSVVKFHRGCKEVVIHIHERGVKSFLIILFPSCDDIYCNPEKGIFLCTTCSPFLLAKTRFWITNFLKTRLHDPEHRHKPTRLHEVTTQKSMDSMTTAVNISKLIPSVSLSSLNMRDGVLHPYKRSGKIQFTWRHNKRLLPQLMQFFCIPNSICKLLDLIMSAGWFLLLYFND